MQAFERIIGYDGIKRELEQTADILRNLDTYKAAGAKTPSGMLIHGDPGLGKSLMAECLIEAAGIPTFTCRKDRDNGAFVDYIRKSFEDAAASAPAIVYLDDMDKFADTDAAHKNAKEFVVVQSCIDSVKGRDVFVIATTNDLSCLPNSLTRSGRFDRTICVRNPDDEESAQIIRHYLSGKRLAEDLSWEDVAMLMSNCSCAELESTLNEALLVSISRREEAIGKASFMEAFLKTRVLMNPYVRGGELTKATESERRRIAVHEAGHTVIYEVLAGRAVSLVTAFRKADDRGGVCQIHKPTDFPQRLWGEILIMGGLGGRAAIDLVYGVADEGSADDIRCVSNIIKGRIRSSVEFGGPIGSFRSESPNYQQRKEILVEAELSRLYQKAKEVLVANREFLDKLADAICENEYLISSDIQKIKETCQVVRLAA